MDDRDIWMSHENKIYAVKLLEGQKSWRGLDTSYWVRIQKNIFGDSYKPYTNSHEVYDKIWDLGIRHSDLETARKNLEIIAKECDLKLIYERELPDIN